VTAAATAAFETAAVTWLCVCSTGRNGVPPDAAWAAANVVCDAAAVAVAIAAGPAESVAAQPANKAGHTAPVKPAAPPAAAARRVTVHLEVQASASDATDAAPLQYVATPLTVVETAAPELSAEACKFLDWRFTPKRVVPKPAKPQEFTRSAAGTATASLFARIGHN